MTIMNLRRKVILTLIFKHVTHDIIVKDNNIHNSRRQTLIMKNKTRFTDANDDRNNMVNNDESKTQNPFDTDGEHEGRKRRQRATIRTLLGQQQ
jgi:hypothetical protein